MVKILGDRYSLGDMIGTGGMADVYLGQDLRLNRKVAIKILRSDLARDPSFVARFRKEALAAAGLNHPGIVAVYDSGEEGANSYIVMELVNGHTLRELIHSGERPSVQRSLEIVGGILDALSYSHENGIIHRDIKPGNIMLTESGDVKVMDFGIARALDDIGATMTNTWNVVGTAQYLSPEQATGAIADRRSDIYSVGCLLYELLTGKPPFTGDTPVSIAYQHVSMPFQVPSEVQAGLDSNLDKILAVALSKDPATRYQNASEMLADIARVMKGQNVTTKIRKVRTWRWWTISLTTFGIIAAIAASIFSISKASHTVIPLQIPNVVGLTKDQALPLLTSFTVNFTHAPDAQIPKSRIASQLPLATAKVPRGSSITLTISDGPGSTIIPVDLIGMSLENARNSLTAVGLTITQTVPMDSNKTPGTVLKVTPNVGSSVDAGSGVILQIANGNLQVPQLVGMSEIQARTVLSQAGFLIQVVTASDPNQALDVVLAQAPNADTIQTIGSTVTITVNKAPA
jgi:serine/threonine protein kinase